MSVPTDVTSSSSMNSTMEQIKTKFGPDLDIAAAIYNVASKFMKKPFLEQSIDEFLGSLEPSVKGAFNFAQATLPSMLSGGKGQYPPTLIFTGTRCSNVIDRTPLTVCNRCNGCTQGRLWIFGVRYGQVWNACFVPVSRAGIRAQGGSRLPCYH